MAPCRLLALALALAPVALATGPARDVVSLVQKHVYRPAPLSLEVGDKIEVGIQRGEKAGTWVPGTVTAKGYAGYYDVNVHFGPLALDIKSVGSDVLRRTEKPADWERDVTFYKDSPKLAEQVLRDLEIDGERRMRQRLLAKGLNATEVQAKMAVLKSSKKHQQEQQMRKVGCPAGYKAIDGDAKGGDQFSRGTERQDTIELCAEDCNFRKECKSFEWSPTTRICNLNKVPEPQKFPHFYDYMFCHRVTKAELDEEKRAKKEAIDAATRRPTEPPMEEAFVAAPATTPEPEVEEGNDEGLPKHLVAQLSEVPVGSSGM